MKTVKWLDLPIYRLERSKKNETSLIHNWTKKRVYQMFKCSKMKRVNQSNFYLPLLCFALDPPWCSKLVERFLLFSLLFYGILGLLFFLM